MGTQIVVPAMVALAVLLFAGAVVADRMLSRRMEQRRAAEGPGARKEGKRDAADVLIDALDRTRQALRQTVESAGQDAADPDGE